MKYLSFLFVVLSCFASSYAQTDSSQLNLNKEFREVGVGKQSENDSSDCSIPGLVFVDEQARFQGGNVENFREWFQKNLIYPLGSEEYGISSRVTIQFIVTKLGKVDCIKILRPNGSLLEKEAFRILSLSPDWTPARHQGKMVEQQFVMPILIHLQ